MISNYEALIACNTLNKHYTNGQWNAVQGHRNNWLLRATYNVESLLEDSPYITLTFTTRTSFGRDPSEVFSVAIGKDILAQCKTAVDVLDYVDTAILGTEPECKVGHKVWLLERR